MVNSFYDPDLEQGCAFEELISFHGGLGGPQTRPFILYPVELPIPGQPIFGAASVHGLLTGWRRLLQDEPRAVAPAAGESPRRGESVAVPATRRRDAAGGSSRR